MSWVDLASDVHVYCACGAAWHGRYAVANPAIVHHRRRGHGCALIDHATYVRSFRCRCAECVRARRAERAARNGRR